MMRPTRQRNPRAQGSYNLRIRHNSRSARTERATNDQRPQQLQVESSSQAQHELQQTQPGQQPRLPSRRENNLNLQRLHPDYQRRQHERDQQESQRHQQPRHQPQVPQQQSQRTQFQLQQQRHQQQQQPQSQPSSQHPDKDSDLPFFDAQGDSEMCKGSRVLLSTQAITNGDSIVSADIKAAVHKDIQGILEGHMVCDICRDIYINPLVLNCAHSFCRYCLNTWLSKQDSCPSCRTVVVFQTENLALKSTINRMVQISSREFQTERDRCLDQRSKAEQAQNPEGAKPFMERLSFDPNGSSKRVYPSHCNRVIKSWRGANGATLWRTILNDRDQVVPRDQSSADRRTLGGVPDPRRAAYQDHLAHDDDDDDDDDDSDDDDDDDDDDDTDDSYYEGGRYSPTESEIETADREGDEVPWGMEDILNDDPELDESASEIAVDSDSDESYVESRRRRMNDLNILAGYVAADNDADYEISSDEDDDDDEDGDEDNAGDGDNQSSTSSEAMIVEEDSDDESIRDRLGLFATRRVLRRGMLSSESDDSDDSSDVIEIDQIDTISTPESSTDVASTDDSDDSSDY